IMMLGKASVVVKLRESSGGRLWSSCARALSELAPRRSGTRADIQRGDKSSATGRGAFGKDTRKFFDHLDRELWNVERELPKPSERFKELLSNATRICTQGRTANNRRLHRH